MARPTRSQIVASTKRECDRQNRVRAFGPRAGYDDDGDPGVNQNVEKEDEYEDGEEE